MFGSVKFIKVNLVSLVCLTYLRGRFMLGIKSLNSYSRILENKSLGILTSL